MKYKLINIETKEEHLCDKVTIDGFDYYVSDKYARIGNFITDGKVIEKVTYFDTFTLEYSIKPNGRTPMCQKRPSLKWGNILATNNPNIDISKVVDEVEKLCKFNVEKIYSKYIPKDLLDDYIVLYKLGYNKSQETHSSSEEDMIEFAEFVSKYPDKNRNYLGQMLHAKSKYDGAERTIDLLQLWKEQQPKTVYYE